MCVGAETSEKRRQVASEFVHRTDIGSWGTCVGASRNARSPAAALRRMRPPSSLPTAPSMGHSVAPPMASIRLSKCSAEPCSAGSARHS